MSTAGISGGCSASNTSVCVYLQPRTAELDTQLYKEYSALLKKLRLVRRAIGSSTVAVKLYDAASRHLYTAQRRKYRIAAHGCCTNLLFTYQGISIFYVYVPCTLYSYPCNAKSYQRPRSWYIHRLLTHSPIGCIGVPCNYLYICRFIKRGLIETGSRVATLHSACASTQMTVADTDISGTPPVRPWQRCTEDAI